MTGHHVYLNEDNAEIELENCLMYIKNKERRESRIKAFEDCTKFWAGHLEEVLKTDVSNDEKIAQVKRLFEIK